MLALVQGQRDPLERLAVTTAVLTSLHWLAPRKSSLEKGEHWTQSPLPSSPSERWTLGQGGKGGPSRTEADSADLWWRALNHRPLKRRAFLSGRECRWPDQAAALPWPWGAKWSQWGVWQPLAHIKSAWFKHWKQTEANSPCSSLLGSVLFQRPPGPSE